MKIKLLLLIILFCTVIAIHGQSPSLILKYTNSGTPFGQNIPIGTQIIDLSNFKQYISLKPLPDGSAVTIATCELLLLNSSNSGSAHIKAINVNGSARHIGDLFMGGIIVDVWREDGKEHGIVAALNDIEPANDWNGPDYTVYGANSFSDGADNCLKVTNLDVTGYMYKCINFIGDDLQTGWHMPSIWELNSCFNAASVVNSILANDGRPETNGFVDTNSSYYFSSTEYSSDEIYRLRFRYGTISTNSKSNPYFVRAVKRF